MSRKAGEKDEALRMIYDLAENLLTLKGPFAPEVEEDLRLIAALARYGFPSLSIPDQERVTKMRSEQ